MAAATPERSNAGALHAAATVILDPITVPAVFEGNFFSLAVMPDGKVYLSHELEEISFEKFSQNLVLDIDASEIAQVLCGNDLRILKTNGRTMIKWTFPKNNNRGGKLENGGVIKEETNFLFDVKFIGGRNGVEIAYRTVAIRTDNLLFIDDDEYYIIEPVTEDGCVIIPSKVIQYDDVVVIHGENGYCYINKGKIHDNAYEVLLKDGEPLKLKEVKVDYRFIIGLDYDGIGHIWDDNAYYSAVLGDDGYPVKFSAVCIDYRDVMGIQNDGVVYLDTDEDCLKKGFPKDENGDNCKMKCVDLYGDSAVGVTENGDVIRWGRYGTRPMVDEEGEPLKVITGQTIKSARKM